MTHHKDIVIIVILVIVLYLIYLKQKEGFSNMGLSTFFNYNDLTSNSSPPWTKSVKVIDKTTAILIELVSLINKKTNKDFYLVNIDNITNNKLDTNVTQYVIDFFVQEKKQDVTLRLIVDLTIDNNNNIKVNTITRSNAIKYDFDNKTNEYDFNACITDKSNFTEKININGFNEVIIPYSLYENEYGVGKDVPTKVEYQFDFLPNMVEKDIHYRKLKDINQKNKNKCNNQLRCWDCNSVKNNNPHNCSCSTLNNFKLERAPLLEQPTFNPSIHKNLGDKKRDQWLFSPTRLEVDHNL